MPYRQPGSPYWYISYSDASGSRIRESSGTASQKEAKALEGKRRQEVHRIEVWGDSPRYTFDELMLRYLEETARDKRSHERDLYAVARLRPAFGGKVIADITAEEVASYKKKRRAAVAVATIARELAVFSGAISHANKEWDWKLPNPLAGRIPVPKNDAPKYLSFEQLAAFMAAVAESESPELRDFVDIAIATGMRLNEIMKLEWARVDERAKVISFDEHQQQKAGFPSCVPLNATAMAALGRRRAAQKASGRLGLWVFSHPDGTQLKSVRTAFRTAAHRAGVKVSAHGLRHTCASYLIQSGRSLSEIGLLLRHKDLRTTMRYAYLDEKSTRAGVNHLDHFMTENLQRLAKEGLSSLKTV